MCLGVPGKIIELVNQDTLQRSARVSFGGVIKEVNTALVPEAQRGDYVIVHAGVAISALDEEEAKQTLDYLRQIEENWAEEDAEREASQSTKCDMP